MRARAWLRVRRVAADRSAAEIPAEGGGAKAWECGAAKARGQEGQWETAVMAAAAEEEAEAESESETGAEAEAEAESEAEEEGRGRGRSRVRIRNGGSRWGPWSSWRSDGLRRGGSRRGVSHPARGGRWAERAGSSGRAGQRRRGRGGRESAGECGASWRVDGDMGGRGNVPGETSGPGNIRPGKHQAPGKHQDSTDGGVREEVREAGNYFLWKSAARDCRLALVGGKSGTGREIARRAE